jgi:hypothetical protein
VSGDAAAPKGVSGRGPGRLEVEIPDWLHANFDVSAVSISCNGASKLVQAVVDLGQRYADTTADFDQVKDQLLHLIRSCIQANEDMSSVKAAVDVYRATAACTDVSQLLAIAVDAVRGSLQYSSDVINSGVRSIINQLNMLPVQPVQPAAAGGSGSAVAGAMGSVVQDAQGAAVATVRPRGGCGLVFAPLCGPKPKSCLLPSSAVTQHMSGSMPED